MPALEQQEGKRKQGLSHSHKSHAAAAINKRENSDDPAAVQMKRQSALIIIHQQYKCSVQRQCIIENTSGRPNQNMPDTNQILHVLPMPCISQETQYKQYHISAVPRHSIRHLCERLLGIASGAHCLGRRP